MSAKIRPFAKTEYTALTAVHNAVHADYPMREGEMERHDGLREEKIRWGRFVAEENGEILAWGSYANSAWVFHPQKFWLDVLVHPDHRGLGIGRRIYDALLTGVDPFAPIVLRAEVREDNPVGRGFSERRGYRLDKREQESRLDIGTFDPDRFSADLARTEAEGIRLRSWSELSGEPDARRKLYDMEVQVALDVPVSDVPTPQEFTVWEKRIFSHPNFLPDLNIIAVDSDGAYVGISNLWKEATKGRVETGLTGVLRSHRKRGIATAMKVKALAAAKAAGFDATLTWNEENNRSMLGINQRLGFEFQPGWLMIENVLDAEALAASLKERE